MITLEHFYYGQPVQNGKPLQPARVLACSGGVDQDEASLLIRSAQIPPMPDVPDGSWAVLRTGRGRPFLMVQAQLGSAGQTTLHGILMSAETLRLLAGRVTALLPLLKKQLPEYAEAGAPLEVLQMAGPARPNVDQQVDDLLELMTYTRNNTRNIEPLLSAVVTGTHLAVLNAPPAPETRAHFIQGLLMLLPSSTRYSVTFASYLDETSEINAQIAFRVGTPPADAVIFDWETGAISGVTLHHEYSRFITSQLRLDAALAVREADALTPAAGWRFKAGDRLADALAYASHRSALDRAVLNNLPVEADEAARVLAEDPTLSSELRSAYAAHLIRFSLALENMHYADPVAPTLRSDTELAARTRELLGDAIREGKARMVFEALLRWMADPLSPQGPEWVRLLHEAALADLDGRIAAHDLKDMRAYLDDIHSADQSLEMETIAPQVIDRLLPFAGEDTGLAARLLLLGMGALPADAFRGALQAHTFTRHLPPPMQRYLALLNDAGVKAPEGAIPAAAEMFPPASRQEAIVHMALLAAENERYDIIDTPALLELTQAVHTPAADIHRDRLTALAIRLHESHLYDLKPPGPRCLLQLMLAGGRYAQLAQSMNTQARHLYGGERQAEYVEMVQQAFALTPLPAAGMQSAIEAIEQQGIQGTQLVVAGCGALEATDYAAELDFLARRGLLEFSQNPNVLRIIHAEAPLALLRYFIAREDPTAAAQTADLMPVVAASKDDRDALAAVNEASRLLSAHDDLRPVALEMLQQFIREAGAQTARRAVRYFGQRLGRRYSRRLEVTYRIRTLMGGLDLPAYAAAVSLTADLLKRLVESYIDNARQPTTNGLSRAVNDLRTGLDSKARRTAARDLQQIAVALVALEEEERQRGSRGTGQLNALARGKEAPTTRLDVLRAAGGMLIDGGVYRLRLLPDDKGEPFYRYSAAELRDAVTAARGVIGSLMRAFPPGRPIDLKPAEIQAELEQITGRLPADEREEIQRTLAADWQRLAALVPMIARGADRSAIEASSRLGQRIDAQQHRPRSPLELIRFVYGCFLS